MRITANSTNENNQQLQLTIAFEDTSKALKMWELLGETWCHLDCLGVSDDPLSQACDYFMWIQNELERGLNRAGVETRSRN